MSDNEEYICYECSKKYPDFNRYQTHVKFKHSEPRFEHPKSDKKVHEAEVNELEDRIYSYFGELSEKYNDRVPERQIIDEAQRFLGQANYLTNHIVRTPYENQIKVEQELPEQFEYIPAGESSLSREEIRTIVSQIDDEIRKLSQKLAAQRNKWQFMDPLDNSIDEGDEFSVMNISRLLQNYRKRGIELKYRELTVFILWIGRILKADAFRVFYACLVSHTFSYYDFLQQEYQSPEKCRDLHSWRVFIQKNKKQAYEIEKNNSERVPIQGSHNLLRNFDLKPNNLNISSQDLCKLLDLYQKWVESMEVLSKLGHSREMRIKRKKKEEDKPQQSEWSIKMEQK